MKAGFSLSIGAAGAPLHAAAHSHHPWPDVSRAAQLACWNDAARLLDRKWDHVFSTVIPLAQAHIARQLGLPHPERIAFAPNTHDFVARLFSCFDSTRPVRVLTTTSEFMSFQRQCARLEEDGMAVVTRISTEPFETFAQRFSEAAARASYDLIFFSHAFYDSGYVVDDLPSIVNAVRDDDSLVVIDGYHAFMAVPANLAPIAQRSFYLAGGYKLAMAGEGVCFLYCPPGYGPRPRDTGWYASFSALKDGKPAVAYGRDGTRFLGATFDVSGLYRFNAVQDWLAQQSLSVGTMLGEVRKLERHFLASLTTTSRITPGQLLLPDESMRARFLAFRTPDADDITRELLERNIIVDCRADRLRIGFGIYHDTADANALAAALTG
ncbi:MAG: aminotransferase class V-fold PLP-dependent enzyme [Rhizomicrobium sp.]